jgi:hypothetical protein
MLRETVEDSELGFERGEMHDRRRPALPLTEDSIQAGNGWLVNGSW